MTKPFSPHPFIYFQPYAGKASNFGHSWTEERVELLKKLWTEGLSASECAKQLGGVTRNAVIGKVHRLGLGGRGQPTKVLERKKRSVTRLYPKPQKNALPKLKEMVVPASEPVSKRLNIYELTEHTCKWLEGEGVGAIFCGHEVEPRYRYCPWHKNIVYREGSQRDFDRMANRCLPGRPDFSRTVVST